MKKINVSNHGARENEVGLFDGEHNGIALVEISWIFATWDDFFLFGTMCVTSRSDAEDLSQLGSVIDLISAAAEPD